MSKIIFIEDEEKQLIDIEVFCGVTCAWNYKNSHGIKEEEYKLLSPMMVGHEPGACEYCLQCNQIAITGIECSFDCCEEQETS